MTSTGGFTRRFVVTVDDAGGLVQDIGLFQRAEEFFAEQEVPATFFVVPRGTGGWLMDRAEDWLAAARVAAGHGHDFQLHGLDHSSYEFGPYGWPIAALGGEEGARRFQEQLPELSRSWKRELFADKLATAIGIFERAFGRRPRAYRSGAASQSPQLFQAMGDVGLRYDSNKITDPRGWMYILGKYDDPGDWDPEVPPGPYWLTDLVIELPITSEYAWYLTAEQVELHLALALDDLRRVYDAHGVFLLCCHTQCIGDEEQYGQELLRRLIARAREDYGVRFQTVTELVSDIEGGRVPVRAA